MEPLLQIKDLDIAFKHDKKFVQCTDHVSLTVNPGEILCVVGESGCGKSITALSVLGLLGRQGRILNGEAVYGQKDLLKLSAKQLDQIRGNEISMIFQDITNSLNPVFTIGNQMAESIRIHLGYDKKRALEHAKELLAKTGIPDPEAVLHKYPHMLSGGMRQRVMIAMALSCRPKLLIADEPTTALDVTIQMQIMQLLLQMRKEYHMGILMITHDIGVVAEMADRVVVMYAGQCVEEGTVEQIFKNPAHPYTQSLLKAVPGIQDDRSRKLYSIPGSVPRQYQEMEQCRFAQRCPYSGECHMGTDPVLVEPCHFARCSRLKGEGVMAHGA